MILNIQSLSTIEPVLEKLLRTNNSRSFSGVFKTLRKERRIDLIGSYSLLSFIIHFSHYRNPRYVWNRNQVLRGVRVAGFYKDEGRKHAFIPKEWQKYIKK